MTEKTSHENPEGYQPIEEWFANETAEQEREIEQTRQAQEALGVNHPDVQLAIGGISARHRLLTGYRAAVEASTGLSDDALGSLELDEQKDM